MKKCFLLLSIFIYFGLNISALNIKLIDDKYRTTQKWVVKRIVIDGKLTYCIEPGVSASTRNYVKKNFKDNYKKISNSKKSKIMKIGLVGERYYKKLDKSYYYAAQELIWDQISNKKIRFTKNLSKQRALIQKEVNLFDKVPKISTDTIIKAGTKKEYNDPLFEYFSIENMKEFEKNTGMKATLTKNKLTISNPINNKINNKYQLILTKYKNYFSNGKSVSYTNNTYQDFLSVNYDNKIKLNINYQNKKAQGKVSLTKVGEMKDTEKTKPLKDVIFGVYRDNKLISQIKTDQKGYGLSSLLDIGEYEIKEITTLDQYLLSKLVYKVRVEPDIIVKVANGIEIVNKLKTGSFKVIKKDEENKPLAKVEFELYNKNKTYQTTIQSNEKGEVKKDNLPFDTYYLKEVKTLPEYDLSDQVHEINIAKEEVIYLNDIINKFKNYKLIVEKRDEYTNEMLDGVLFSLNNGFQEVARQRTVNGIISFSKLKRGCYTLKEEQQKVGYQKNEDIYSICFDKAMVIKKIIFNEKIDVDNLIIEKLDKKTKQPLNETTFMIYNDDFTKKIINKTNKNGIIVLKLAKGCYNIKEVKAKANYILDNQNKKVCLSEKDRKKIVFYNKRDIDVKVGVASNSTRPVLFILISVLFYRLWLRLFDKNNRR